MRLFSRSRHGGHGGAGNGGAGERPRGPVRALRDNPVWLERALSAMAVVLAAYMSYATIFGPYRTTLVHRAVFLGPILVIFFLSVHRLGGGWRRGVDVALAAASVFVAGYVAFRFEHIANLIGASFLTPLDLIAGALLLVVVLEAARRQSFFFFLFALVAIAYTLYGQYLPGVFQHAGIGVRRFVFLNAFGPEGVFGIGLAVATNYLFMFVLLGAALQASGATTLVLDMANASVGHLAGGPGKASLFASAGLGTIVGSSIGNVVTTGTITIPVMKRAGFKPHVAAAIEVLNSEGAQLIPPIMGAGAFIMAELIGVPYATIALAAIIPSILYYLSAYLIIHLEARKQGLEGLPRSKTPARKFLARSWHLGLPIVALFYLLLELKVTVAYAGLISLILALIVCQLRRHTRLGWRDVLAVFDRGVRDAVAITALIAALGLIQQAFTITGLGGRFSEILLALSGGSALAISVLAVVVTVLLGMGMPTPIAYVMAAIFVGPSLVDAGFPVLAAHMFLFFFAIKSGSTPPVAVVAVVAAGIAGANWWRTGWTAFLYSVPGWLLAFAFLVSPSLLLQSDSVVETAMNFVSAALGITAVTAALCGYGLVRLGIVERLLLGVGAILLVYSGATTDALGLALVGVGAAIHLVRARAVRLERETR